MTITDLDPAPRRPALARLASAARMLLVSLVCVVIGVVLFIILFAANYDDYGEHIPGGLGLLLLADLVVGVLANAAAGPMRRAGLWNLLLVVPGLVSGSALPAAAVALARVGTRREARVDIAGITVSAIAALGYSLLESWAVGSWSWAVVVGVLLSMVFAAAALLWGRGRATRAALITSLRNQAATAQRERAAIEREHEALAREHQALVAQAESEQRAAIARDMHDSLSHHLSLIAMHAGALSYRADMPPEQMRDVAATILGDARSANAELRHVLSALRTDDAEPLPTGAHVLEQVERARADGQDVCLTWDGTDAQDVDAAGSAVVVTLSRAIRELLTNARKHAPGAAVSLEIVHDGDELRLTSRNASAAGACGGGGPDGPAAEGGPDGLGAEGGSDGLVAEGRVSRLGGSGLGASGLGASGLGAGLGLTGLRERARLLGGSLRVDGNAGAGAGARNAAPAAFEVRLALPWPEQRRRDDGRRGLPSSGGPPPTNDQPHDHDHDSDSGLDPVPDPDSDPEDDA